jgi:hypothetical protein
MYNHGMKTHRGLMLFIRIRSHITLHVSLKVICSSWRASWLWAPLLIMSTLELFDTLKTRERKQSEVVKECLFPCWALWIFVYNSLDDGRRKQIMLDVTFVSSLICLICLFHFYRLSSLRQRIFLHNKIPFLLTRRLATMSLESSSVCFCWMTTNSAIKRKKKKENQEKGCSTHGSLSRTREHKSSNVTVLFYCWQHKDQWR